MTSIWEPEKALADVATGKAADHSAAYAALLAKGSVAYYRKGDAAEGTWGIFSHAEIDKAAVDIRSLSNVTVPPGTPRILPLMADPPEHTAYRRLINPFFAPSKISATEEIMRPIAAEMIDALIGKGDADFADYAYHFSMQTLCRFLRVKADWRIYHDWSSEMERLTGSGTVTPGSSLPMDHFLKVVPYIQELISDRRAHPGDDVVSGFIAGEIDGNKLDDQAITGLVIALILAGRSTTASGIGNFILRLARDRNLQDFLRAHPDRIKDAIEESLRIESPQQEMPRMAVQDIEVGGQLIKAGESVFLNYGSANLDPARWENPHVFDIDRKSKMHFAFGRGVHQCFGAPLGRMQMRVTAEELLRRTVSFELAGEVRRHVWPRLSVEQMPLRFTAA